jgi:hypothetical protein
MARAGIKATRGWGERAIFDFALQIADLLSQSAYRNYSPPQRQTTWLHSFPFKLNVTSVLIKGKEGNLMSRKMIILFVAALMIMLMASFSFAANVPPAKMECQENFKSMDTNNDQAVSKDEFLAAPHGHMKSPEQMFTSMDTNGNKSLDVNEFCAHTGKGIGRGKGMTGGKGMRKGQPY